MPSWKNKHKTVSSRFHVDLPNEEYEERGVDVPEEVEEVQPDLFPGEIVIATANNVLKFAPGHEQNAGISGTLFVTNLRVTLLTTLPSTAKELELYQLSLNHLFLGVHDIELSLVADIRQLDEQGNRKKVELPLPDRVSGVQLTLKNFRVVNFSFKFSPTGEGAKVLRALLHHTNPASTDLLFLTPGVAPPSPHIPSFRNSEDWEEELQRTSCRGWRVTLHNENYNLSESLPQAFVVPDCLVDKDIERASNHFREARPIYWLWGAPGGAALVVMAHISPNIGDTVSLNPRTFTKIKMRSLTHEANDPLHRKTRCTT